MPIDSNDWELRNENVEQTMQKLATSINKSRLVIYSNQAGLNERRKKKTEEKMIQFRRKLQDVMGRLAVPITIMIATD